MHGDLAFGNRRRWISGIGRTWLRIVDNNAVYVFNDFEPDQTTGVASTLVGG